MTNLVDLMPELYDKKRSILSEDNVVERKKLSGKKRRAWLLDDHAEETKTAKKEKNTQNQVVTNNRYQGINISKIDQLRGNPIKVLVFLYSKVKNEPELITDKVTRTQMANALFKTENSIRTALRFLKQTKLIFVEKAIHGQNGGVIYRLNEAIAKNLASAIREGKVEFPLSHSDMENSESDHEVSDIWENIDISPLEQIGLTRKHLLQLKQSNSPEVVQESVNNFAYTLEYKTQTVTKPIAALISVLKRGGAWIDPEYKTPQEMAQKKLIEQQKKRKAERESFINEMFKLAFDEWHSRLSTEKKNEIIQANKEKGMSVIPDDVLFRTYFKKEVWEQEKERYLGEAQGNRKQ